MQRDHYHWYNICTLYDSVAYNFWNGNVTFSFRGFSKSQPNCFIYDTITGCNTLSISTALSSFSFDFIFVKSGHAWRKVGGRRELHVVYPSLLPLNTCFPSFLLYFPSFAFLIYFTKHWLINCIRSSMKRKCHLIVYIVCCLLQMWACMWKRMHKRMFII